MKESISLDYISRNNNKLEKNIVRLFKCYVLSKNQNGGNNNELSHKIKKKLNKKITELITYYDNLEGGVGVELLALSAGIGYTVDKIITSIMIEYKEIKKRNERNRINEINDEKNIIEAIRTVLNKFFKDLPSVQNYPTVQSIFSNFRLPMFDIHETYTDKLKRREAERLEAERVKRLEAERIETERIETERIEAERIETERIEAERKKPFYQKLGDYYNRRFI